MIVCFSSTILTINENDCIALESNSVINHFILICQIGIWPDCSTIVCIQRLTYKMIILHLVFIKLLPWRVIMIKMVSLLATFICSCLFTRCCRFRWVKDAMEFDPSSIPGVTPSHDSGSFTVIDAAIHQFSGNYSCLASNELGTAVSNQVQIITEGTS